MQTNIDDNKNATIDFSGHLSYNRNNGLLSCSLSKLTSGFSNIREKSGMHWAYWWHTSTSMLLQSCIHWY